MKRSRLSYAFVSTILIPTVLFSSCATLLGGANYNAHVVVNNNHPNAEIIYQGKTKGYGTATFKVPRGEANKFSFTVREKGCQEQTYDYKFRTFRTAAFLGTVAVWTGIGIASSPVVAFCGPIVDFATGAIWKPNVVEAGITQENVSTFKYLVDYNCSAATESIANNFIDIVYLNDGNIFKGYIVEQTPNVEIKMQTTDGNKFVFKFTEIKKIEKEKIDKIK